MFRVEVKIKEGGWIHFYKILVEKLPVTFTRKGDNTKYFLDPKKLFIQKRSLKDRILDKIKKIQASYSIFFLENNPVAWTWEPGQQDADDLLILERSDALRKGLKSEYSSPLALKKMIFVICGIVILIVSILIFTGNIRIPGMRF